MIRPVLTLALAFGLQATAHIGSTVLDEVIGVELTSSASAAVPKRARRAKIKKRIRGGYRISVRSNGDDAATATIRLQTADGEPVISSSVDVATHMNWEAPLDNIDEVLVDGFLTVTYEAPEVEPVAFSVPMSLDGDQWSGESSDSLGRRVRFRVANGIISNQYSTGGAVYRARRPRIQTGNGALVMEPIGSTRQLARVNTDLPLDTLGPLRLESVFTAEDGTESSTLVETIHVGAPVETPSIDTIAVRSTRRGHTKVVTWTTSPLDGAVLQSRLVDGDTGEVHLEAESDQPTTTQFSHLTGNLEFEDDASGHSYLVLVSRRDASGAPLGETFEVTLQVPDAYDGAQDATFSQLGEHGVLATRVDSRGTYLVASFDHGETVDGEYVSIQFEEPFDGPAPLEPEITTERTVRSDKWVTTSTTPLPSNPIAEATLQDVSGASIDTVTGAPGSGVVYKKEKDKEKVKEKDTFDTNFGFLEITRG